METETLSNYQQSQEKHILDDDVNISIPSHDDNSNSLHVNEISEADSVNGENCDETVSSSESKIDKENSIEEENYVSKGTINNGLDKSINSPNVSSTNHEEEEGKNSSSSQEESLTNIEDIVNNSKISLEENQKSNDEITTDNFNDERNNDDHPCDNNSKISLDEESQKSNDGTTTDNFNKERNNDDHPCESEQEEEGNKSNINAIEQENDEIKDTNQIEENKQTEEKNDGDPLKENKEAESNSDCEVRKTSLLKETLTKQNTEGHKEGHDGTENDNAEEMEMDDDFDPSLLCPDIAMEIDEAPVITTTDNLPADGNKSPQLYEPVYSTYVDEMTGAEVTFNLTPDEHYMRQATYGEHNPVQFTKIHCTACNVHLGSALDGQGNRFVHPLLKVLICKNCYHFYTSGEFEKDEDGSELYCRWCGQGGQVMCCSSCEMVFCKKCIRINFGRKKLIEIRDSDDWYCFRCNPLQLTELRVHCAEFMEYVRREISRAATLENATSFMTTDYTQCCVTQKKKSTDPQSTEPKKRRKKHVDPDYDPESDTIRTDSPPVEVVKPKSVPILPKPIVPSSTIGHIAPQTTQGIPRGMFRVGNTTFKPRIGTVVQAAVNATVVRPQVSTPGFIKIMPGGIRAASSMPRPRAQTFVSSVRPQQNFQQRQIRPMGGANGPGAKHEWFEKTVRAAARVNSNLSYTLTQLNRAQATATSVEALAVVHNKLQEILSTSINSLIQIRKNLRSEFIAGIKNIRAPPKPPLPIPIPSTSSQDDDVIFVSPTTSPIPPPIAVVTSNNLPPSVTLTNTSALPKRSSIPIIPTTSLQPIPSTSTSTDEKPKAFLRVKSLSALQSVTSECITIPDDPLPPPPLVCISPTDDVTIVKDKEDEKEKEGSAMEEEKYGSVKEEEKEDSEERKKEDSVNEIEKEGLERERDEDSVVTEKEKDSVVLKECDESNEKSETEKNEETSNENSNKDPLEIMSVDLEKSNSSSDEIEEDSLNTSLKDEHSFLDPKNMPDLKIYLIRSEEVENLLKNNVKPLNGE